jgi:hypothetical protein
MRQIRMMLAYLCVASEKEASLERKVEILDKFSLSDSEIATICLSSSSVNGGQVLVLS